MRSAVACAYAAFACQHCACTRPPSSLEIHAATVFSSEVFITCPGCGRSLKPETEKCPECSAIIEREYRGQSIEANVTISQASINADKIETFNPGVVMVIMVSDRKSTRLNSSHSQI